MNTRERKRSNPNSLRIIVVSKWALELVAARLTDGRIRVITSISPRASMFGSSLLIGASDLCLEPITSEATSVRAVFANSFTRVSLVCCLRFVASNQIEAC
jgi:hypothetical protein